MATSQVTNKITIKDGEIHEKLEQKFTMTSAATAPLMSFSVNGKKIGSITNGLLLTLNEEIVKELPAEIKEKIVMLGTASMKIQQIEDGIPPIEIDAKNNELKVHIKAKDGSKIYECRINATGIYLKYDGNETNYSPKTLDGNLQAIDVTMSTNCFAKMLDKNNTEIKLSNASKTDSITPKQIPNFMLGTFLEASATQEELVKENEMTGVFKSFTLSLPSGEDKSDYHFVKNDKGQIYAFHNGTLNPVHSFAIFTTREKGKVKEPYLKMNIGSKAEPKYAYINLPTATDEGKNIVEPRYLDAVMSLHEFTGMTIPKAESGLSVIGSDTKGNKIKAEWASSDDERKFDTGVKGKSYTFNLSSEETYPTDEIVPTTMDATPIDTPVEIDENTDKNADQIETTPVANPTDSDLLAQETPFASTPMKAVDMSKVKSKISPDWGVNMMLIGMVLMLVGLLFAPALTAVFACVGVAVTAGGAWLAVNADRLANPYLKLEQYIIDPLKKKERQREKEQEAVWEDAKELNGLSSQAYETKENLLDFENNEQAKFWQEIFGENYEEFISDDNLPKRQDFLSELKQITTKTGAEKDKMMEIFKSRYGLSDEAIDSLFNDERIEQREKALAEMRTLNQQQESAHKKQAELADNIVKSDEILFKQLLDSKLSPEAQKEFIKQNKYAIARHLVSQNHTSHATTEKLLSVLSEDSGEIIKEAVTELAEIPSTVSKIAYDATLRAKDHQKTRDYADTLNDIKENRKNDVAFGSSAEVGKAAVSYIIANSVSNAKDLQEIEKLCFGDTDLADTIKKSIVMPDNLKKRLEEQQSLLTNLDSQVIGEKVMKEGLGEELSGGLGMTMTMNHLDISKVDDYTTLDIEIEKQIAENLNLTELENYMLNKTSKGKSLTVDQNLRNEFATDAELAVFSKEQRQQLATLSLSDDPAIVKIVDMAKSGTLLPALKSQYVMKINGLTEQDITNSGVQGMAVIVNKKVEECNHTRKLISRLNPADQQQIIAQNPKNYEEYEKAVKSIVGKQTRENTDGKTIDSAVKEGLVKKQEDIKLEDKIAQQELYKVERISGKAQTKSFLKTAIAETKKQNNIKDEKSLGQVKELKQANIVKEDKLKTNEGNASKQYHKKEEKHNDRTQNNKEAIEKLVEILNMPDDTGKEKINALSNYVHSFDSEEVGSKSPFSMPKVNKKGFNIDKWLKGTIDKVKNKKETDEKDFKAISDAIISSQKKTKETVSATKYVQNAKIALNAMNKDNEVTIERNEEKKKSVLQSIFEPKLPQDNKNKNADEEAGK